MAVTVAVDTLLLFTRESDLARTKISSHQLSSIGTTWQLRLGLVLYESSSENEEEARAHEIVFVYQMDNPLFWTV